jgi:hypothetical protein
LEGGRLGKGGLREGKRKGIGLFYWKFVRGEIFGGGLKISGKIKF